ncbi:MAG: flagella synthesis protein FlgN [Ramlibacter sp.]
MMEPLLGHLVAQGDCLDAFIAALEAEDLALRDGRLQDLPALTGRKHALLARIAELDHSREAAQIALGHPPGRAGADAAAASQCVQDAWAQLLARAERARDLNRRVAAKVFTHLDHTTQALAVLQADRQPLYGRDGVRSAGGGAPRSAG